jgi:hypothetical protein
VRPGGMGCMEQPGHWRHFVWLAGMLVAACAGGYTGAPDFLRGRTHPLLVLSLAGLAALGLATAAILPAHSTPRAKVVGYMVTWILYALASFFLYLVAS